MGSTSLKQHTLQIVKGLWLLVVLAGGVYYVSAQYDTLIQNIQSIDPIYALISLLFISIGRVFSTQLAIEAVALMDWRPSFRVMFKIFWVAEPGKYIPGGIWHLVGRAASYRASGLALPDVGRALFIENIWLAISSSLFGSVVLVFFSEHPLRIVGSLLLLILWISLLLLLAKTQKKDIQIGSLFALQVGIGVCFGASYAALVPIEPTIQHIGFVMGAFCISWLIGFITPFALGGIGTREAVLIPLTAAILPADVAILFAGIHRLFWTGIELTYAFIALILERYTE